MLTLYNCKVLKVRDYVSLNLTIWESNRLLYCLEIMIVNFREGLL